MTVHLLPLIACVLTLKGIPLERAIAMGDM